jgi:hypothetical protein
MIDSPTVWIDISRTTTPSELALAVSPSETYDRWSVMEELGHRLNENGANATLRKYTARSGGGYGGDTGGGGGGGGGGGAIWSLWIAAAGSGGVMTALVVGLQRFFERHKDTKFVLEEGNRRIELSGLSAKELERVMQAVRDSAPLPVHKQRTSKGDS